MMEEETLFYSDGIPLSGAIHLPRDLSKDEKRPAVVVCYGFCGWKDDLWAVKLCDRLNDHGIIGFRFDHRGSGMSGGERGRIICREQVEDILNAVTFLTTIPSVDATRIGLIGYSLGGGNVTYASGIDDRVSFTVSVAGIGDGERWLKWCYKTFRSEVEWRNLLDRLMKDRVSRVLTGRSEYVDAMEVQPLSEDVKRLIEDIRRRFPPPRGPVVKIPLQTGESIIFFRPEEQAKKIAPRPILWIHGDTDDVVSVEESRSMYSESDKSGELIIIPDADHFMLGDVAKPMFDHLVGLIVKWIGEKVSKKS